MKSSKKHNLILLAIALKYGRMDGPTFLYG